MKAIWQNTIIAQSDNTVVVEGNHYFPQESVKKEYLRESNSHTVCPWKGTASYYDLVIGEYIGKDAAWYYPEPKEAASEIKDHVAFDIGKGVKIAE